MLLCWMLLPHAAGPGAALRHRRASRGDSELPAAGGGSGAASPAHPAAVQPSLCLPLCRPNASGMPATQAGSVAVDSCALPRPGSSAASRAAAIGGRGGVAGGAAGRGAAQAAAGSGAQPGTGAAGRVVPAGRAERAHPGAVPAGPQGGRLYGARWRRGLKGFRPDCFVCVHLTCDHWVGCRALVAAAGSPLQTWSVPSAASARYRLCFTVAGAQEALSTQAHSGSEAKGKMILPERRGFFL